MQGYRFYAVMPESRGSKSASKAHPFDPWTVARLKAKADEGFRADLVAVMLDPHRPGQPVYTNAGYLESLSPAIEGNPLSYAVNGVSRDYLAKRATRVPADLARRLSPELFTRLES